MEEPATHDAEVMCLHHSRNEEMIRALANTPMNLNVLSAARDSHVPTVVLLSAAELRSAALNGGHYAGNSILERLPRSGYMLSKIFSEISADLFRKLDFRSFEVDGTA